MGGSSNAAGASSSSSSAAAASAGGGRQAGASRSSGGPSQRAPGRSSGGGNHGGGSGSGSGPRTRASGSTSGAAAAPPTTAPVPVVRRPGPVGPRRSSSDATETMGGNYGAGNATVSADPISPTSSSDAADGPGPRVPSIARRSVSSGAGGGADSAGGGGGGYYRPTEGAPVTSLTAAAAGRPADPYGPSTGAGTAPVGNDDPIQATSIPNITTTTTGTAAAAPPPTRCLNPAQEINNRLDSHVEVRVYPCNNNASSSNSQQNKKKFTQFTIKPEGVIIQGANSRHRTQQGSAPDLGLEYANQIGRRLRRYELSDTRACQLLVTTHGGSYWAVPAPEAFSRHSGTCRLLGDRKHPLAPHTLQVGDFLRVGSVGVVVIETHDGAENKVLSEEKIRKIMKDTTSGNGGGFLDFGETDEENSDDSMSDGGGRGVRSAGDHVDENVCYMCFDNEDTEENPLITPCKCRGDTRYVHVNCLRKWHTAEADNQICFLSSVDATCSVCKSTFKSDFRLKDGRTMKLFKSSLEPPYVSLLVATKHEMAQRLFNTRFQLSFSTLLKPDGKNGTRPLLLGRSSGSDMVLDYRTVSARHASIRFKNGEFIFTDAGSSNGSYLYLRRPVELTPSQSVQFRLGRSMISMKVVNKWNRRFLRAMKRSGNSSSTGAGGEGDDHSVGSNDDDVRVTDGSGSITRSVPKRTRESIMNSLPPPGTLSQASPQHLDLLYALAYPKRESKDPAGSKKRAASTAAAVVATNSRQSSLALSAAGSASASASAAAADVDPSSSSSPREEEESKMEESEPVPGDVGPSLSHDDDAAAVPVESSGGDDKSAAAVGLTRDVDEDDDRPPAVGSAGSADYASAVPVEGQP